MLMPGQVWEFSSLEGSTRWRIRSLNSSRKTARLEALSPGYKDNDEYNISFFLERAWRLITTVSLCAECERYAPTSDVDYLCDSCRLLTGN